MKALFIAMLSLLMSFMANAQQNSFIGLWQFEAPDFPVEYCTGSISFISNDDGTFAGAIITNGREYVAENITFDEDKAVMDFNANGRAAQIVFSKTESGLIGTADMLGNPVKINCTPFDVSAVVIGKWNYRIDEVPQEYGQGEIEIVRNDDGTISAYIIAHQQRIRTTDFKPSGTNISFLLTAQEIEIPISLEWRGGVLTGTVLAQGQPFRIRATRPTE